MRLTAEEFRAFEASAFNAGKTMAQLFRERMATVIGGTGGAS